MDTKEPTAEESKEPWEGGCRGKRWYTQRADRYFPGDSGRTCRGRGTANQSVPRDISAVGPVSRRSPPIAHASSDTDPWNRFEKQNEDKEKNQENVTQMSIGELLSMGSCTNVRESHVRTKPSPNTQQLVCKMQGGVRYGSPLGEEESILGTDPIVGATAATAAQAEGSLKKARRKGGCLGTLDEK